MTAARGRPPIHDDYADPDDHGFDNNFPGAWLETVLIVSVWLGGMVMSVLIHRGLIH